MTRTLRKKPLKHERDAYTTALHLLTRREHSCLELTTKLAKKGFSEESIEAALALLQDRGLQSEQRFAEQFVRSRLLKGNGPMRIQQELHQRGIDKIMAVQSLDSEDVDWLEVANTLYLKKYGSSAADDYQEKARRMRYMQSKGFPSDIIRQVIGE